MENPNTDNTNPTQTNNNNTNNNTPDNGSTQVNEEQLKQLRADIEAEFEKKYNAEADRRVTEAIKKKQKEWDAAREKEKMTAEQKAAAEAKEKAEAQAKRELEYTIKGLKLDVVDAIADLKLPTEFRNLIAIEDLAYISDEDERKKKLTERVKGMKSLFDKAVEAKVAEAKAEFMRGTTPPAGSNNNNTGSKYDEYKKAGNVKGMLSEKMANRFNNE